MSPRWDASQGFRQQQWLLRGTGDVGLHPPREQPLQERFLTSGPGLGGGGGAQRGRDQRWGHEVWGGTSGSGVTAGLSRFCARNTEERRESAGSRKEAQWGLPTWAHMQDWKILLMAAHSPMMLGQVKGRTPCCSRCQAGPLGDRPKTGSSKLGLQGTAWAQPAGRLREALWAPCGLAVRIVSWVPGRGAWGRDPPMTEASRLGQDSIRTKPKPKTTPKNQNTSKQTV